MSTNQKWSAQNKHDVIQNENKVLVNEGSVDGWVTEFCLQWWKRLYGESGGKGSTCNRMMASTRSCVCLARAPCDLHANWWCLARAQSPMASGGNWRARNPRVVTHKGRKRKRERVCKEMVVVDEGSTNREGKKWVRNDSRYCERATKAKVGK